MEQKKRMAGDVVIIELKGEIMGGKDTEKFRKLIYETIEEDQVKLVIDLSNASWMNSSGLGMLISGLTTVRSSGGDLRLANMTERVRRPLEITKLESVFLSYDSLENAINSFKSN